MNVSAWLIASAKAHSHALSAHIVTSDHERCSASKVLTNHRSPAYTFRGVDQKTHSSEYPGPGEYKWPEALGRTRPANPPLAIKFRFKVPADVERRPAPNAYDPTDPLKMYQGQYAKVTIKQRCGNPAHEVRMLGCRAVASLSQAPLSVVGVAQVA